MDFTLKQLNQKHVNLALLVVLHALMTQHALPVTKKMATNYIMVKIAILNVLLIQLLIAYYVAQKQIQIIIV